MQIQLRNIQQLFNSLDPSPFSERDLEPGAETYLVDWARELPHDAPLTLALYLQEWPDLIDPQQRVSDAIHHYFSDRALGRDAETREQLRRGRFNLLIGIGFLALCLLVAELLGNASERGLLGNFLYDGLTIVGWVVMWRPLETFLFDYWHWRRQSRIYRRMAAMPVELHRLADIQADEGPSMDQRR
ncbi:hypothetical protein E4T66_04555 [Sinimarinibacterium sp. CAU 1509]|uniref:hypothetical protein n=1 Tax=Sinimarinibacterium sp. CAU 1509 TaxID=2562283 RepID=UPI0010ACF472|nr:hypothetical protein [Sinimarinibacterium sp. CAU 1509]TJY62988.1 hypothetical protein E4T66_04555 [Sinimarinibacterium sp. CAU 1509]